MKMRACRTLLTTLALVSACDESVDPADSGIDASMADAGDGSVTLCAANRDCDDAVYCNGTETCEPGADGAGSDGCVAGSAPCAAASCDETDDTCSCPSGGDADDDGVPSMACGGADCDDDDPNRYPGNTEVCDAEAHDEDCDPSTLGGTDADTDGFLSAACCNGDVCGADCDDDDINVNPAASETCDGVDNNCSGTVDTAEDPLCPGGTCTAGTCRLDAWIRTFGGAEFDRVYDVDQDAAGNVYVAGAFTDAADFGAGSVAAAGDTDAFVASYAADGSLRWQRSFGFVGLDRAEQIAVDGAGRLYVAVVWVEAASPIDFGGGSVPVPDGETDRVALVALNASDGSYSWHRQLGSFSRSAYAIAPSGDGVLLSLITDEDFAAGGLTSIPANIRSLSRYRGTGEWVWTREVSGLGSGFAVTQMSVRGDEVLVGGPLTAAADLGGGPLDFEGPLDVALARYRVVDGSYLWSTSLPSPGRTFVFAVELTSSGHACAGGRYSEELWPAAGIAETIGVDEVDGYIICVDAAGAYAWHRVFPGSGGEDVLGIASDASGNVYVAGDFSGSINLGSGLTATTAASTAFVARYDETGAHTWDRVFSGNDSEGFALSVGPAESTVVVGQFFGTVDLLGRARVSAGASDAFIVRLDR